MASLADAYHKSKNYHHQLTARLWENPHPQTNKIAAHGLDDNIGVSIDKRFAANGFVDQSKYVPPPSGLSPGEIVNAENNFRLYSTYTVAPGELDYNWVRQSTHDLMHKW